MRSEPGGIYSDKMECGREESFNYVVFVAIKQIQAYRRTSERKRGRERETNVILLNYIWRHIRNEKICFIYDIRRML